MIVSALKTIIDQYAEDEQCGMCWKFIHARKDYSNLYEASKSEKCCTHFILEKYGVQNTYDIDSDTGISSIQYQDYSFEAFVGVQSDLDRSYDNELSNDRGEGKYLKYIEPIESCINEGFQVDFCEQINSTAVVRWQYQNKINYKDTNFDGVYLKGTLRTYHE